MALPTFVIGGAPKAGTTALRAWLRDHPQVWMTETKEPHFLTRDVNNPAPGVRIAGPPRVDTFRRGWPWYESLFEPGSHLAARGEASTHYLGSVDTPSLIAEHLPGLKVIFVLRQPVQRAYSHYWQGRKRGWQLPPFEAILRDHPALRYLVHAGRYRANVGRYVETLGRDRVHLLLSDDIRADPGAAWRGVCAFLQIDPSFVPRFEIEHNPHAEPAHRSVHELIGRSKYGRWSFLPPVARRPMRRLRDRVEAWNLRRAAYEPIDPAVSRALQDLFADDIAFVEEMVRPLPEWRLPT
jgi:hypothetical protein